MPFVLCMGAFCEGAEIKPWQDKVFNELCQKYLGESPIPGLSQQQRAEWVNRLVRQVGTELSEHGAAAVPAQDLAMLALLLASSNANAGETMAQEVPPPGPPGRATSSPAAPIGAGSPPPTPDQAGEITRGQEGFRQAQEMLARLPVSERMVINGDITAGVLSATVPSSPDLANTFGRLRVNLVMRAISGGGRKGLGDGYFFAQLRAAGGAADSSVVGGPRSFTAFDDVALDRSAFNESTSRGNLYVSKVFYQQRLELGEDYLEGQIGIINLSDYFDINIFANNESRQFLNQAFVNSAAYKTGIAAPGFQAGFFRKMHDDRLNAWVLRAGYAISRTDRAFTSPIWTGEWELQTTLHGYKGHWRLGGTLGNRAGAGSLRGLHLSVDQWLRPHIGVFGRYAVSNSSPGSLSFGQAKQSYSGGVQVRFVGSQDRVSAWGVGFSQAFGIRTNAPLASERVLETYYRWQWTQHIVITPDFQIVLGSGGRRTNGTQVVFGSRLFYAF